MTLAPLRSLRVLGLALGLLTWVVRVEAQSTLIPFGRTWRYLDDGSNQGTGWRMPPLPPASDPWASGVAPLGYGDPSIVTTVSFGSNSNAKYITTHFRHAFEITDLSGIEALELDLA